MFTGIVEEKGTIESISYSNLGGVLVIKASKVLTDANIGDSIAVNGVCLTASSINNDKFSADVMSETFNRTNLSKLSVGDEVNLERAMAANGRFGGHIVSGHIDGTGVIRAVKNQGNSVWITICCSKEILNLIVEKGSIAIDGISLTVAYVDDYCFKVSIIPHTGDETTLLSKKPNDLVNLENDVLGKYVQKILCNKKEDKKQSNITMEFLMENGF